MPLHSIGIKHQIVKVGCVSWWLVSSPLAANQRGFIESKRHIHLPMQAWTCRMDCCRVDPGQLMQAFCEGPKPFPTTKTTVTSRPAFPASILPVFSLFLATQQWALAWGWIHSVDLFSWLLRLFAPWFNEVVDFLCDKIFGHSLWGQWNGERKKSTYKSSLEDSTNWKKP